MVYLTTERSVSCMRLGTLRQRRGGACFRRACPGRRNRKNEERKPSSSLDHIPSGGGGELISVAPLTSSESTPRRLCSSATDVPCPPDPSTGGGREDGWTSAEEPEPTSLLSIPGLVGNATLSTVLVWSPRPPTTGHVQKGPGGGGGRAGGGDEGGGTTVGGCCGGSGGGEVGGRAPTPDLILSQHFTNALHNVLKSQNVSRRRWILPGDAVLSEGDALNELSTVNTFS